METIKIRGLAKISAWMFAVWGGVVTLKGLYDIGWGQPDANQYAPTAWAFVSQEEWLRYSGFETLYGAACLGAAWYLFKLSRFLPETVTRKKDPELRLLKETR